ncbi:hypothetical protein B0J13DRAFT_28384 [Dactylonectria estremocensis]|uniref:Pyridine nucleotide-disulfide oxidoreductase family protein n=1 Tax=Dactylonectria estremocensis TaxID=1079267 RepID=A0A9P9FIX0_9HYPO|nr:hypothetical protein B0J13DRAFT_28384 [Dactylonectria estremocensis]
MESPLPTCVSSRNFQYISVGKCHAQTATDRFGDGAKNAIRDRERASVGMHPHNPEMPFTWPGPDSDDEQEPSSSIYRLVPSMQKFRNNLTALSQEYNLYFVTYQGRIFVYRPRTVPTQTLPRRPDLQLAPKPSVAARSIGGFLDTRRPHLVNNIVTGFLGKEEVVVACFDDGDVVAYYVKEVAERVLTRRRAAAGAVPKGPPRYFFHENVGISAWGLAVHRKSRLIAVSSNRHEVTVFAFGLTPDHSVLRESLAQALRDQPDANVRQRARNWRIVVLLGTHADNVPNVCFIDDDDGFADKICAIDIKGAIWLAAIWKVKQPPIYIPPLCHPHLKSEEFYPAPSRGWGVLALPESSFVQVETTEELFGLPASRVDVIYEPVGRVGPPLVNVRRILNEIPGNPCRLPPAAFAPVNQLAPMVFPNPEFLDDGGLLEDVSDASDMGFGGSEADSDGGEGMEGQEGNGVDEAGAVFDIDAVLAPGGGPMNILLPSPWFFEEAFGELDNAIGALEEAYGQFQGGIAGMNEAVSPSHTHVKTGSVPSDGHTQVLDDGSPDSFPTRLDMTFFPHNGLVHPTPRDKTRLLAFLERPYEYNVRPRQDEQAMAKYANKLHLLRTYEKDIEMRGFCYSEETGRKECGVLCPDALNFGHFREPGHRNHFHATSRLNMFAHAPELGLVVIGSPTGRVVLLTLTRMAVPAERPEGVWEHGFRVEWVLPTQPDEEKHRKVLRPLHGMALGPVQVGDVDGKVRNAALPRRYRLMLHYRNHDILSYEISRENETGKLCIF